MIRQVVLGPAVRATLAAHVAAKPDLETGGILVGRHLDEESVEVTAASPPGPRATHRRFSFSRDTKFLQSWLDEQFAQGEGEFDYVGEWHVHLALNAPPSSVDRRSLFRIARKKNYATSSPILIIVESSPPTRRFCAYGFAVKPKRVESALVTAS